MLTVLVSEGTFGRQGQWEGVKVIGHVPLKELFGPRPLPVFSSCWKVNSLHHVSPSWCTLTVGPTTAATQPRMGTSKIPFSSWIDNLGHFITVLGSWVRQTQRASYVVTEFQVSQWLIVVSAEEPNNIILFTSLYYRLIEKASSCPARYATEKERKPSAPIQCLSF